MGRTSVGRGGTVTEIPFIGEIITVLVIGSILAGNYKILAADLEISYRSMIGNLSYSDILGEGSAFLAV